MKIKNIRKFIQLMERIHEHNGKAKATKDFEEIDWYDEGIYKGDNLAKDSYCSGFISGYFKALRDVDDLIK